jgi:hypothetical protein
MASHLESAAVLAIEPHRQYLAVGTRQQLRNEWVQMDLLFTNFWG